MRRRYIWFMRVRWALCRLRLRHLWCKTQVDPRANPSRVCYFCHKYQESVKGVVYGRRVWLTIRSETK
jgi:hypothetical protein